MAELGQRDWSQGWRPDDDAVNGHAQGLLRMDNVNLDENGALTVVRGTNKVSSSLGTAPFRIFSREFSGQKYRYSANVDGTVKRSVNESTTFSNIITGGSSNRCGFGVALGNVLITSGSVKKKDPGGTVADLGIAAPASAPTISILDKPTFESAFGTTSVLEGTDVSAPSNVTTDATTGRAKIKDINSFGSFANVTDPNTEIEVAVTIADSDTIQSVKVEWFMAASSGDASGSANYFHYEWKKTDTNNPFKLGLAQINYLKARVGDIPTTAGSDNTLDWTNIETVILTIQAGPSETIGWNTKSDFRFAGKLNGTYTYYQVNVNNNGIYNAKSPVSALSTPVIAKNQDIFVSHGSLPAGVNEIWIFRRKEGFGGTSTWYRVAVRTSGTGFTDNMSDQTAINIGIRINLNLAALPNNIIDIVGNYGDRTLYLTSQKLYISDSRNPDAIDNRATLDFSGEQSEKNLWIRKSGPHSVLVGTTEDIYEVQGTLELLADGTIDARIVPLGMGFPPIAYNAATVYNHQVFYMANDGWRITVGANAQSIVGGTRLLYEGVTRHGIEGIGIFAQGNASYGCCVSGGKLFTTAPFVSTSAFRMYVYDLEKKYWYPYFAGPICLFTEEDGDILAGFGGSGDQFIRELETGAGIDQSTGWTITVVAPFLDAGMPSQRKDLYVLHVFADTGDVPFDIDWAADGDDSTYTKLDELQCDGPDHKTFELNSVSGLNLAKTISLRFQGVSDTFKLYHWFITFEERPVPLNFLRLRPTNYGIPSKKRIRTIPFVIDTLGNNVTLTPRVDGSNQSASTLNSSEKRTLFHYFTTDIFGIDYEYRLQCAGDEVFEFYEAQKPEEVEILPVAKKFDQIGPFHTEKLAKMTEIRVRLIAGTTSVAYTLKASLDGTQTTEASGTITTVVGTDSVYTIPLAKTVKGTIWHLELSDTVEFNRYWAKFRYALSGDETNLKQKSVE